MSYARHRLMTDPARPSAELWRLVVGLVLCLVVWFGLARGVIAVLGSVMQADAYMDLLARLQTGTTPGALLLVLALTGTLGLGVLLVSETLHGRPAHSLFGPWPLFRRDFLRVLGAVAALNLVVLLLPPWDLYGETQAGLALNTWLLFLPTTLMAVLLQTGAEELFFRGYFQSQLAARLRHRAIWLGVPSLAFGLGHYMPEVYGDNALAVALWSVAFGLAAGDLTARAGNLGPAIALHFANNFLAFAVISLGGDMSGLALRQLPFGPEDSAAIAALLPVDLLMIGVSWLAARVALRL
ncbi:CPBP family intramembrane glutamic endopeptidase [Maliponia aquimaris]|uniref:CAAX amino terminal protease self- immunity n=1 Tax=Maliponia aquimaris TaxID=1673631 RepID=A0A238JS53_9RHOB|nr:CPBP family intramembrane glutamic endopeptidase [Maliponia aquimaris]SMX33508.1 CAAX amino terminal protease self- immunity [Maliponia aquimaris]